jgi:hypothetical protein
MSTAGRLKKTNEDGIFFKATSTSVVPNLCTEREVRVGGRSKKSGALKFDKLSEVRPEGQMISPSN